MLLFSVKPKLQLVQENLRMSQSNELTERMGVGNFRMKPNQFQKEEVNLFNIPKGETPYRIPGTKIGIMSSEDLNAGGRKDEQQMSALLIQVQLAIDCMKRVSHASKNAVDYKYDALEITDDLMQVLSHKQQLQILNDLVNLRSAVKKMSNFDQRWVEVIQTTRSSLNQTFEEQCRHNTLPLDEANQTTADAKNDSLASPPMLSNKQQRQESAMNASQTDGQLHLSKRPLPPQEEPPADLARRPLSPKGQAEQDALEKEAKERAELERLARERANMGSDGEGQKARKRYTSKYRTIKEFLEGYESEYKQLMKQGELKKHQQRDFIQENIDNQQYFKKGYARKTPEDFAFQQEVDGENELMSELMMRVAMQQLCFRANNGDLDAYNRLVVLQERYKKLYEIPEDERAAKEHRRQVAKDIKESVAETARRNEEESLRQQALADKQREAIRQVLEERARQQQKKEQRREKEYTVMIPCFSAEHVKTIKAEQKKRMLEEEKHYLEVARNAKKDTILINKRSPQFETLFGELCDSILFDIQMQSIRTAVESISAAVQCQ